MADKAYDLVIVGGGAAAFAAAIRANSVGARTVMINDGLPLGGTCVNVGCVPTKTLLRIAGYLHHARENSVPGVETSVNGFDFPSAIRHEISLVERMRSEKYANVLAGLQNVDLLKGRASFVESKTLKVNGEHFSGEKIIIATGSTTTAPDIPGLAGAGYLTHIEALSTNDWKLPASMAVIGAGPVGVEFSQMFARFGVDVTLLVRGERIIKKAEPLHSTTLTNILHAEGVDVLTRAGVESVEMRDGKKVLTVSQQAGKSHLVVDEIFLATGKTPNTGELGLEHTNVAIDGKQAIIVNESLQTDDPAIFAAGDVAALPMRLEPTAGREGSLAAENALTNADKSIDYDTVPFTVFTDPELAGVGWTESRMMQEQGSCLCRTVMMADVPRAIITGRTEGAVTIVAEPNTRIIKGIHILAPGAGELIAQGMTIVKNHNTLDDVMDSMPMFPTYAEGLKIAAMSFDHDISKLSCCV